MTADAEHEIGKHPEDYSLYRIGTYDDNAGSLAGEDKECLATALEMLSKLRNVNKQNLIDFDTEVTNKRTLNENQTTLNESQTIEEKTNAR